MQSDQSAWVRAISSRNRDHLWTDPPEDVDASDKRGVTALMIAAQRGTDLIIKLLGHGADVDLADKQGKTALIYAVAANNHEAVSLLLSRGANPDAGDAKGTNPLIAAATRANDEIVRALLGAGAKLDSVDHSGMSALMWSARTSWNVARMLVEAGADTSLTDPDGKSALAFARASGRADIALLLEDAAKRQGEATNVEVECVCLFPPRFAQGRYETSQVEEVLRICARFVGNQIAPKYKIDERCRNIGVFTDDPELGAGARFSWHVQAASAAEIASETRSAWEDLMAEIGRHGVQALLDAGRGRG